MTKQPTRSDECLKDALTRLEEIFQTEEETLEAEEVEQLTAFIEVYEGRQNDHADADGPDHLQVEIGIGRIETPEKADYQ